MSKKPFIQFESITKQYLDKKPILSNAGFNIDSGEFLFLTGISGAGKSTVFKMLMGLEKPDQGTVFVNQTDVTKLNPKALTHHLRQVGMVFQDYKLLYNKSVHYNIRLPLQITGASHHATEKKIRNTAVELGLEGLLKQKVESLSGGEQQLVAIARASIHSPPLILADEPTANLDHKMARRIFEVLKQIKDQGKTVIIATHDIQLIKSYEARTLLIKNAEIIEVR